jgi:ubiquinone/menaquinone biosynthesis C-methylase UbiE
MSTLATNLAKRIAKLALRLLPAYPEADYRPLDQISDDVAMRLARAAYDDESESGCGFLNYFANLKPAGDMILDLGCGFGGRTLAYQRVTSGHCIGLEIDVRMAAPALRFAQSMRVLDASFAAGVGEALPFANDSFDAVLSYDVLEHVQDPQTTLAEVYRVLKAGGLFLVVFPPYFHPKGSHLEGYASRLPYANLVFSSKTLLSAIDELLEERGDGYRPQPLRPGDRLYGLNGLTIRKFRRMTNSSEFEVLSLEYLPLLNKMIRQYDKWKMQYYAWVFRPLSRVRLLQELFTHRIVAILRKPQRLASAR